MKCLESSTALELALGDTSELLAVVGPHLVGVASSTLPHLHLVAVLLLAVSDVHAEARVGDLSSVLP